MTSTDELHLQTGQHGKNSYITEKKQRLQHFDAATHHLWDRKDQHGSWQNLKKKKA